MSEYPAYLMEKVAEELGVQIEDNLLTAVKQLKTENAELRERLQRKLPLDADAWHRLRAYCALEDRDMQAFAICILADQVRDLTRAIKQEKTHERRQDEDGSQ